MVAFELFAPATSTNHCGIVLSLGGTNTQLKRTSLGELQVKVGKEFFIQRCLTPPSFT